MRFLSSVRMRRVLFGLSSLGVIFSLFSPVAEAGTIGTVVPVIGVVADLIYDSSRNQVYLANYSQNEVDIYSVSTKQLIGSVPADLEPVSLALSPDLNTLYVANLGSSTISTINLNLNQRGGTYSVTSPEAIAVGNDGQVLILAPAGLELMNPANGIISPVPISPPPTASPGVTITPSPTPSGFLPSLVTTASGNLIIGLSSSSLFVYQVASGVVLTSRAVTGMRSIMSASPDGSRFMAGPFLFDTQTLKILGRTGTLPTGLTQTFAGGSAFSADGNSVYATFSTQPPINPLNPNNPQNAPAPGQPALAPTSVLQVLLSSNLVPQLGLRLPEAISSKIIASPDGQNLFATSRSGITVIPIGQLTNLPVISVSSANVVLSSDACNRTIATATVQINNLGAGRMTFSARLTNGSAPVTLSQRTGLAPGTLTMSFDPGLVTGLVRGTQQYVLALTSPEAVNIEPAILVSVNFRDVSDRGTIVPINGVGVAMQMDTARQRLYIANYTQGQIEIFSLATQTFLSPIRVGNRPISMAMPNPSTLVVANYGSEHISVVDLDAMQEIEEIPMGPLPLNASPLFPRDIAVSSNAILFSAVPLPSTLGALPGTGSIWQLSLLTNTAFPRLNLGTGTANMIGGHNVMAATANGNGIFIADATTNNTANLRFYDPISDTFPIYNPSTTSGITAFRGAVAAGADGSFYAVDNYVLNSALGTAGLITPSTAGVSPTQVTTVTSAYGDVIGGNTLVRVQPLGTTTTPGQTIPANPVQALQEYNLSTLQQTLQVSLPEQVLDISPSQIGLTTGVPRQWPPVPVAQEIGVTGQTQILPHGMALDASNNAYLLTFSGFSIVSLTSLTGPAPSFRASGVINTASRTNQLSPGSLVSIMGTNLASSATANSNPLPQNLGGVCVTANEVAIPLISTSPTEIDGQLPTQFGTGSVTLTVRSTALGISSAGVLIPLNATSPGVFSVDGGGGQQVAAIIHGADFALVNAAYPAQRDETIILYTTGLGPVNPTVASGQQAGWNPFSATTDNIQVAIGGVPYPVLWSGLSPYMVGIYQINLYVPGDHVQGDNLPVVVTAGGISSATDNNAPVTSVH